jgi:LPS export ABC transporter protein LptC
MSWLRISLAALLAALVIGYGAFTGRTSTPPADHPRPAQPGYYLTDAVITQTQKDGSIGLRLIAERIEQRPFDDSIALAGVRVNYFQAVDTEWLLTARRATAPADSRIVTFLGDVELRPANNEGSFLRTDALAVDLERNLARSVKSPAQLQFGQHTLAVQSFTADLNTEKLHMESVRGAYATP